MEKDKASIIDRLLKIWNLATRNPDPHEAELAMTRLREMMAKHQMSMADVEVAAGVKKAASAVTITEVKAYTRKGRLAKYDHTIAAAVSVLTSTKSFIVRSHVSGLRETMTFIGSPEDAETAAQLFHVFLRSARVYARLTYGGHRWDVQHSSFVHGFGTRLWQRARDWTGVVPKEQHAQYAMVLASKENAIDAYEKEHYNRTPHKKRDPNLDLYAFLKGKEHADTTDLGVSKKIVGGA